MIAFTKVRVANLPVTARSKSKLLQSQQQRLLERKRKKRQQQERAVLSFVVPFILLALSFAYFMV